MTIIVAVLAGSAVGLLLPLTRTPAQPPSCTDQPAIPHQSSPFSHTSHDDKPSQKRLHPPTQAHR